MTTTPFNEIRRVEQIKAELRARDEFEQAKVARGRELTAELTARAEAKTHERYMGGAPGNTPERRIALATAHIKDKARHGEEWVSGGGILALLHDAPDPGDPPDPPAKLIGLTDAGKHVLELEKRIAEALKIADAAEHDDDDGEHIAYILRMRNVLRGVDEWSI